MPLKNIQKHRWKEEDMKQAIAAVRNHTMGYFKASQHYKVPRATLFRYFKNDKNVDDIKKDTPGRHPTLPPELEAKLVNHTVKMEKQFFGLTRRDVEGGRLTEEKKYSPKQIFNVNECGICIVQSKCPQIIALKGKRQIGAFTSSEREALITVSICMSADGTFVPPMIIFPRKNCYEPKKDAPPGSLFKFHSSGWIQMDMENVASVAYPQPTIINPGEENENPNTSVGLVNPVDIAPIPTSKKKVGTRGRKPGKANIITSTPNKQELEESVRIIKKAHQLKKGKTQLQERYFQKIPLAKKDSPPSSSESASSFSVHNSSDDEDVFPEKGNLDRDAYCIFCDIKFSENTHGEMWVMCLMCSNWAHEECAGYEKEPYICDFCR
ncbi:hypothetical protein ILUMI_22268 [Ignelater luminosus]|uniref:HTH psq-type domain-containing protein n=1 Tax=Ignelater luminosus TaxID=2038154 RepID=A0A8K0CAW8_IGNLU|nr:hypothetical protein ILUMI_22268 [Ignelater luminosus]